MIQPKPPPKTIQQILDETVAQIPRPPEKNQAPMFVFAGTGNQINASLQGDIYVNQAKAGERAGGVA